jgi:hypothetical protein
MNTMALTRGAALCGFLAASLAGQTPATLPGHQSSSHRDWLTPWSY